MSILHFDRTDGQLLAVDEVTVAGVGSRSVTVQRREPESYRDEDKDEELELDRPGKPERTTDPGRTDSLTSTDAPG